MTIGLRLRIMMLGSLPNISCGEKTKMPDYESISKNISITLYEAYKTYNKRLSSLFSKEGYGEITANSCQYLHMVSVLNKYEDWATITGLSNRLGVKKSSVIQMINNLLKSGYLTKKNKDADRRGFALELTEKGLEILRLEEVFSNNFLNYFCDTLSPEEMQALESIAKKISAKIHKETI